MMMMKTFVCLAIQRKQREIMRKRRRNQERKHKRTFLIINASVLKGAVEGVGGGVGKMGKCSCQYEAIDMTRSLSHSLSVSLSPSGQSSFLRKDFSQASERTGS